MTAPDARQSDELRGLIAEALRQYVPLTSWQRDVRAYALAPGEAQAVADAILPAVTAWHEKTAEAQARARAAEELRKAALEQDRQAGTEAMSLTRSLMQTCHAAVARQLHARAAALAADDRTDPA